MHISSKPKTFSSCFIALWKSTQNFEAAQRKDDLHSLNISEVIDSEQCGFLNARKCVFQNDLLRSTC